MTNEEYKQIKLGDIVSITTQGSNQGKRGVVVRNQWMTIYLRPLNGDFEFTDPKRRKENQDFMDWYGFNYRCLKREN